MAVDEGLRHEIHQGLVEVLGKERGDGLMELLPPVGWGDLATRVDLDHRFALSRAYIDLRFSELQAQMDQRFAAMQTQFDERFAAMQTQFDERFAAMQTQFDERFAAMQTQMDQRFAAMQAQMDERFAAVEHRLDLMDVRMSEMEHRILGRLERGFRLQTMALFTSLTSMMIVVTALAGR